MNNTKKILFLTGTRADFGKIKSLIQILESHPDFEPYIFVTGMHLQEEYGYTLLEVERCGFKNIHTFQNHTHETTMDLTLAKTVSNKHAKKRLIQMGELIESIFIIGSPDVDIMFSNNLPDLETVKKYYEITFDNYAIVMFHPVTTEAKFMEQYADDFVDALLEDKHNYVVVFPNNDLGSTAIIKAYEKLKDNSRFRIFPSLRFEYFLTLLKKSQFIIGNSSAGIREAPYYGLPIINIGTRQQNRSLHADIINVDYSKESIVEALQAIDTHQVLPSKKDFGNGNSAQLFLNSLLNTDIWQLNHQKQFKDIN